MKSKIKIGLGLLLFVMIATFGDNKLYAEEGNPCIDRTIVINTSTGASSAGVQFGSETLTVPLSKTGIVFTTNAVCNATLYEWTVGSDITIYTQLPSLRLDARDFYQLPAGGCRIFNDTKNLIRSLNGYKLKTAISVKANAGQRNIVVLPVEIDGVKKCKGIDLGESGPTLGGVGND